jgi:4-hydroxythreonine-4-phosphate dehydrogenase
MTCASGSHPSRLAISIGCPSGIGPEVSLLAALRAQELGLRCALIGDAGAILRAAALYGVEPRRLQQVPSDQGCFEHSDRVAIRCPLLPLAPDQMCLGVASAAGGRAQLGWVDHATGLVNSGAADALVTGPVSKHAIAHSGAPGADSFAGHTEHIARLLGSPDPIMIFVADSISVALVTTHLALSQVPRAITPQGVATCTLRLAQMLWSLGKRPTRVVVAALNPHAGEQGMFGSEESQILAPGIKQADQQLAALGVDAQVDGPIGAETAFRKAFLGQYDGVVAMYHDQGTIPMKVRCFGGAVNVTAGLPIIRTSVDHGTGYDIAGTGKADPSSMLEAIVLADRLVVGTRR